MNMKLPAFLSLLLAHLHAHDGPRVSLPPITAPTQAIDLVRMVAAIETVENTRNDRIGRHGERSRLQITLAVWRQHSTWPFEHASSNRLVCRAEVTRVALRHLDWLSDQLTKAGMKVTPYLLALAYGAGLEATVKRTASAFKCDYAQRVLNVYMEGR